jgi:ribosome-associated translation inhibitor RaiA
MDGVNAGEASRLEVRAWLERLGALTAPMTGGHVVIESIAHLRKETRYRVHMELELPTGVVAVPLDHPSNGAHEDVYVAIRNAFRAARRQLELHLQEHRAAAAKEPPEPMTGGGE